jgi:hypothetical protein
MESYATSLNSQAYVQYNAAVLKIWSIDHVDILRSFQGSTSSTHFHNNTDTLSVNICTDGAKAMVCKTAGALGTKLVQVIVPLYSSLLDIY